MLTIKFNAVKPGGHYLTVQHLGSGWAAVEMWLNNEEPELGVFPEPWNTGFGRYARREQALAECLIWSEADEIPVLEGNTIQVPAAR